MTLSDGLSVTCEANTITTKTGTISTILNLLNANSHISITDNNVTTQRQDK
jgi:hypothetical protein